MLILIKNILELCLAFFMGAALGSFGCAAAQNIDNYWRRRRSKCDSCGKILSATELIPVVSYLWLKGKCKSCRAPISPMCLFTEIYGGLLGVMAIWFGVLTDFFVPLSFVMIPFIIIHTVTDFKDQVLYDYPTFGLILVAIAYKTRLIMLGTGIGTVLLNSVLPAAAVGVFFFILSEFGGMGAGDILLAIPFCLLLDNIESTPVFLFVSTISAVMFEVIKHIVTKRTLKGFMEKTIPFGPYICFGGYLTFIASALV